MHRPLSPKHMLFRHTGSMQVSAPPKPAPVSQSSYFPGQGTAIAPGSGAPTPTTPSIGSMQLQFPAVRTVLWDRTPQGDLVHLQSHDYSNDVIMSPSALEEALRCADNHPEKPVFLVARHIVDEGGKQVTLQVERVDTGRVLAMKPWGCGPISETDVCIQLSYNLDEDQVNKQKQDLVSEYQTRCAHEHRFLLRDSYVIAGNLQSHTMSADLELYQVAPAINLKLTPVAALRILQSPLSRSLFEIGAVNGSQTGYVTLDQTRKAVLLHEEDPYAMEVPLIGLWIGGISSSSDVYVYKACMRFLQNTSIKQRVLTPGDHAFLLLLYDRKCAAPRFLECSQHPATTTSRFFVREGTAHISSKTLQAHLEIKLRAVPTLLYGKNQEVPDVAYKFTSTRADASAPTPAPPYHKVTFDTPQQRPSHIAGSVYATPSAAAGARALYGRDVKPSNDRATQFMNYSSSIPVLPPPVHPSHLATVLEQQSHIRALQTQVSVLTRHQEIEQQRAALARKTEAQEQQIQALVMEQRRIAAAQEEVSRKLSEQEQELRDRELARSVRRANDSLAALDETLVRTSLPNTRAQTDDTLLRTSGISSTSPLRQSSASNHSTRSGQSANSMQSDHEQVVVLSPAPSPTRKGARIGGVAYTPARDSVDYQFYRQSADSHPVRTDAGTTFITQLPTSVRHSHLSTVSQQSLVSSQASAKQTQLGEVSSSSDDATMDIPRVRAVSALDSDSSSDSSDLEDILQEVEKSFDDLMSTIHSEAV
eukprot:TRINITY_DN2196_c0_g1_i1.p1 TRINITY_DN2196_c0_g1~~TRINITY_DN2196_c0_g1_i1.p1  ORF type:complete len:762 (-),score=143.17 TRINITY_DN2196_c0_g1_i1:1751-4036(-)